MTPGQQIQRILADVPTYDADDIAVLLPYAAALQSAIHARILTLQHQAVLRDTDHLLDTEQTASRLGTSSKWVRENIRLLPFGFLMGKLRRFSAKGLNEWIDKNQAANIDAALLRDRRQHER